MSTLEDMARAAGVPVPRYSKRYMIFGQHAGRPPVSIGIADLLVGPQNTPDEEEMLEAARSFGIVNGQYTAIFAVEIAAHVRLG